MQVILRMMSTRKRMSEVVIEKRDYMLFDKYELNTDKVITRYECNLSVPLRISKRTIDMRKCKCGGELVPLEVFMSGVDQSKVDKTTEIWLDIIEDKLSYKKWYCGHYHTEKKIDNLEIMFENFDEFGLG